MIERVILENGKYTFEYNTETSEIKCLRFGEEWKFYPIGDKALYSLFQEALKVDSLQAKVIILESTITTLEDRIDDLKTDYDYTYDLD